MGLRILFVPFGSEGDVNPLIWIAEGLQRRGHEPVFLITPHYARLLEARGIAWIPIGAEADFLRMARNPDLWDAKKGSILVLKETANTLDAYREAFERSGAEFDLVVTSTMALAAAALAQARGIPWVTVHMQPICLRSVYDCPLFQDELQWLCQAPKWLKRLFFFLTDLLIWNIARKPLNGFRQQLGLPPIKDFYCEALHGADGVAAFFPSWFAAPQPDWPPHVRQFGFPVSPPGAPLPSALRKFLEAGPPPVVWTHGSANFDIQHFQTCALRASREAGVRCLLVSLDPPRDGLPEHAFHASHVPFENLFPHCAAAVHHGGIGTTAKAIASAVPQLIVPRSHDQPDNALRIEKLGLGMRLHYRDLDSSRLVETLKALLDSEDIPGKCREFQRKMADDRPEEILVWMEHVASKNSH